MQKVKRKAADGIDSMYEQRKSKRNLNLKLKSKGYTQKLKWNQCKTSSSDYGGGD